MSRKTRLLISAVLLVVAAAPLMAELSSKARKAEKMIVGGDISGAAAVYQELMEKNSGKNPELAREGREGLAKCRVLQAKDALQNKDYAGAEKPLREVLSAYQDTPAAKDAAAALVTVRLQAGDQLISAGGSETCVALMKELRTLVPADTPGLNDAASLSGKAWFTAGMRALQAKNYEQAISSFAAVAAECPKDDPLIKRSAEMVAKTGSDLIALAESQIKAARYDDAAKNAALALTAVSDPALTAQAKYDIGLACRLGNQPDKALSAYQDVVDNFKAAPAAPSAAYDIYLISRDKGDLKAALAGITAAVALDRDNLDYLFIRAGLLKDTGAVDEARKSYTQLVDMLQNAIPKTFAGKEKMQYRLGLAYLNLESYPEAAVEFDKALIRDPSLNDARRDLALAQFKVKSYAKAAQNYDLLIKQESAAYDKMSDAVARSTVPADAGALDQLHQRIAFYHYQNGLCAEQLGDLDKAEQECRLGLEGVSTREAAVTLQRIQLAQSRKPAAPPVPAPAPAPAASAPVVPAAAAVDQPGGTGK